MYEEGRSYSHAWIIFFFLLKKERKKETKSGRIVSIKKKIEIFSVSIRKGVTLH